VGVEVSSTLERLKRNFTNVDNRAEEEVRIFEISKFHFNSISTVRC
jgi:hypothetical protein